MIADVRNTLIASDSSQPGWLAKLQSAVSKSVTEDDISTMIQAQVEKAKAGDAKACKFVLDLLATRENTAPVNLTQNNFLVSMPDGRTAEVLKGKPITLEEMIYVYLQHAGPSKLATLVAQLQQPKRIVLDELTKSRRFSVNSHDEWQITFVAR